jgi:hypothetical protein
LVWSDVLDAILVKAHADSNCISGLELQKLDKKKSEKTIKHSAYLLT